MHSNFLIWTQTLLLKCNLIVNSLPINFTYQPIATVLFGVPLSHEFLCVEKERRMLNYEYTVNFSEKFSCNHVAFLLSSAHAQ